LRARAETATEIEILVLRHQLDVLRRPNRVRAENRDTAFYQRLCGPPTHPTDLRSDDASCLLGLEGVGVERVVFAGRTT
jgi:hypothetical protein